MAEQIKSFFASQEFAFVVLLLLVVGAWVSMSAGFMPPFVQDKETQRIMFATLSGSLLTALKMNSGSPAK
jgi:hypothetical protein